MTAQIDAERTREVRDRIDRKIMDQLQPIDLAYQLLDGVRSLTRYDHSSAVLMNDGTGRTLELVAEQIAWRKAKSQRIGQRLAVDEPLKRLLMDGTGQSTDSPVERMDGSSGRAAPTPPVWQNFLPATRTRSSSKRRCWSRRCAA